MNTPSQDRPALAELIRLSNRLKAEAEVLRSRARQMDAQIAILLKNQLGENWVVSADSGAEIGAPPRL